jgi:hypothetical protein
MPASRLNQNGGSTKMTVRSLGGEVAKPDRAFQLNTGAP